LTGSPSQIEWAEQIRSRVSTEFDRVSSAFQGALEKQTMQVQAETRELIAILEEKRAEVMANGHAGYFIRDWQELSDQVRKMIAKDSRYQAIAAGRAARRTGQGQH